MDENQATSTFRQLRQAGYKLTPQRRAIVTELTGSAATVTPAQLHTRLAANHSDIGLVTVYRTLEILSKLGLVCRFNEGPVPSYQLADTGHHHHLVCRGCGQITDFSGFCPHEAAEALEKATGFRITEHKLEFAGYCRQCEEVK